MSTTDSKTTQPCTLRSVIERLENLQKWDCSTGDCGPFAGQIDWEKDNEWGNWIDKEDIEKIIEELKSNAL